MLFLIDQSSSMAGWTSVGVADMLNRLLSGLLARCTDGGVVRDFLHVGVIGYGTKVHTRLLGPISRLPKARPGVLLPGPSDGHGRLVKVKPWPLLIWFDPQAGGGTPMCAAIRTAMDECKKFMRAHPDSFPPLVINLTDGEATDGDPLGIAHKLTALSGRDGRPLMFNLHLSGSGGDPIEYPAALGRMRNPQAHKLFEMSSVLPEQMRQAAARMRVHLEEGARGFAYNARLDSLARFLDIGLPGSMLPTRRSTRT